MKNKRLSQLPYAQQLQVQKLAQINYERQDAALTVCKLACVALNDTEGLGYMRLCRFATHLEELCKEYYADREQMEDQLNRRLEQIGFEAKEGRLRCFKNDQGGFVK